MTYASIIKALLKLLFIYVNEIIISFFSKSYQELLTLAKEGDDSKIDNTVLDILHPAKARDMYAKFNTVPDIPAFRFGKVVDTQDTSKFVQCLLYSGHMARGVSARFWTLYIICSSKSKSCSLT